MRHDEALFAGRTLSATDVLVALAWGHSAGYRMGAEVSDGYAVIQKRTRLSRRPVILATKRLVEAGWLTIVHKKEYQRTVYRLSVPDKIG